MTTYGPKYLLTEKIFKSRMIHNTTSKQYTTCPEPRVAGWSLRPRPTKNSTIAMPSRMFHLLEAHSLHLFPSLGDLEWNTCHKRKPWLWFLSIFIEVQLFVWKSIQSFMTFHVILPTQSSSQPASHPSTTVINKPHCSTAISLSNPIQCNCWHLLDQVTTTLCD